MIGLSLDGVASLRGETPIAVVEKNKREELRVSLVEGEGRHAVIVRVWAITESGCIPTKAGFNLSFDHVNELISALQQAQHVSRAIRDR